MHYSDELYHHGIKGMKWGVRRYQNEDGSLTAKGQKHRHKLFSDEYNEYRSKKKAAKQARKGRDRRILDKDWKGEEDIENETNSKTLNDDQVRRIKELNDQTDNELKNSRERYKNEVRKAKEEYKSKKSRPIRDAVKEYSKAFNKANREKEEANKAWDEAKQRRKELGGNAISRTYRVIKNNKNDKAVQRYNQAYDKASKLGDKADESWATAKEKYRKTGRNRISRIYNNARYDR